MPTSRNEIYLHYYILGPTSDDKDYIKSHEQAKELRDTLELELNIFMRKFAERYPKFTFKPELNVHAGVARW